MMNTKDELRDLANEVIKYLNYLRTTSSDKNFDNELYKILKANTFLMLYNMVESTATSAFSEIYDAYGCFTFDDFIDEVKIIILKNVKLHNSIKLVEHLSKISRDLAVNTFVKRDMFSGNIDAKLIRDTMHKYKISKRGDYKNDDLVTIKNKRNDLSHGVISFAKCGGDYSLEDLRKYAASVLIFLRRFLNDVSLYIDNMVYIKQ